MAKLTINSILLFALLVSSSHSAIKPKEEKSGAELYSIQKKIHSQTREITRLKNEIQNLEDRLGTGNKKYLKILERKRLVESSLEKTRTLLQESNKVIDERTEVVKKLIESIVVNSINQDGESAAQLLSKKIMIKAFTGEYEKLQQAKSDVAAQEKHLAGLKEKYDAFRTTENELLNLMKDWEETKRNKAIVYVEQVKEGDTLKRKFKELNKVKLSSSLSTKLKGELGTFLTPVDEYIDLEYGKKGVTYKFRGRRPVRNARAGQVDYSGKLSTFGNVVMIDHGNQTRSIFLGQFVPRVKKGTTVNVGDILGYTSGSMDQIGKIYFEVRKRNKVQNTIYLMDEKSLARARLASDNT